MTENRARRNWTLDERVEHQRKLDEELRQWKQEQAARKESERVAGLRQEMEAYKERRLRDWMDHGGDPESFSQQWPQMMKDYLDAKQAAREVEREIERETKLVEAEEENYPWSR